MKAITLFLALALAGGAWGQMTVTTSVSGTATITFTPDVWLNSDDASEVVALWSGGERIETFYLCALCHDKRTTLHQWRIPCVGYGADRLEWFMLALCSDCERKVTRDGKPWPWSAPATKEVSK